MVGCSYHTGIPAPLRSAAGVLILVALAVGTTRIAAADALPSRRPRIVNGVESHWTETSDGFKYRDRDATTGIASARLKAGAAGKASIVVKRRGEALGVGPLPLALDPTVSVQLLRLDGTACWSADYSTAIKNQVDLFKAKSE